MTCGVCPNDSELSDYTCICKEKTQIFKDNVCQFPDSVKIAVDINITWYCDYYTVFRYSKPDQDYERFIIYN